MALYTYDGHAGGAQQQLLNLIEPGSTVLDLGCASGYLGSRLTARGCRVWGIDRDKASVQEIPGGAYVDVAIVDIDGLESLPWPGLKFEVSLPQMCLSI